MCVCVCVCVCVEELRDVNHSGCDSHVDLGMFSHAVIQAAAQPAQIPFAS